MLKGFDDHLFSCSLHWETRGKERFPLSDKGYLQYNLEQHSHLMFKHWKPSPSRKGPR